MLDLTHIKKSDFIKNVRKFNICKSVEKIMSLHKTQARDKNI